MSVVSGMVERERIAYRRGVNDGLLAMREKIKELLLENGRLLQPILGPTHYPVAVQNWTEPPVSGADLDAWLAQPGTRTRMVPMIDDCGDRTAAVSGNGRGQR
jgi:hypothetical protein